MSNIIGNPDRERTSKVDTEKWKEHKAYYSNPKNPAEKTEEKKKDSMSVESPPLEKILEYNSIGHPKITLSPFERTAIHVSTQEEYDTLMQVYESGGWICNKTIVPTRINLFVESLTDICISGWNHFYPGTESFFNDKGITICSTDVFYNSQKITTKIIKELNEWYDKHRPFRASKG